MGDMADMAFEQMIDDQDFGRHDTLEDYGVHVWGSGRRQPKCKYCGSTKVTWVIEFNKWRLLNTNDGEPHTCKEYWARNRRQSYYTGRELVLTEPLLGTKRNSYVPYLDWAISIVRQRDVEVSRQASRESRFAYNGHAW